MISLKKLIIEGRYDSLITALSRRMLTVVKDSYAATKDPDGKFAGEKIYYTQSESAPHIESEECPHIYFEEIENNEIPLEFYLTLKVLWKEGLGGFHAGGDAYNETTRNAADAPLIEIRFDLDPNSFPNILSKVALELRDLLRHEIEHITQSGWNLKPSKYLPSDQAMRRKIETGEKPAAGYFLLKKEIPAMIHGLYMKAKKSKTPFAVVVNNYLDNWVLNNTITETEKQKIISTWKTYLPKLGIRQEL
jgi:hypothetical protein